MTEQPDGRRRPHSEATRAKIRAAKAHGGTLMWVEARRAVATWMCPRCYAPRGEPCRNLRNTITGGEVWPPHKERST